MANDSELIDLITHGREERNLEYKGPVAWDEYQQRLAKCIMAIANIRDGGAIVIGVEEDPPGTFTPVGLSEAQRDSFKQDEVARYVSNYADPYVEITLRYVSTQGMDFVVIQVKEFDELPVICRKDGVEVRGGAIYTRTRRVYECAVVPGQAEMREMIEMATEKGIRTFQARVGRLGYTPQLPDQHRFEEELDGI